MRHCHHRSEETCPLKKVSKIELCELNTMGDVCQDVRIDVTEGESFNEMTVLNSRNFIGLLAKRIIRDHVLS